jgi:magnesium-protoporphyrin IX monomethyl ester (oxidative) cyclase
LVTGPQDLAEYAPLGFGYLAAYLHANDLPAKCSVESDVESLLVVDPDVIGLSCCSQNYRLAMERAKFLRERCRAKLVLGGPHISCLPESLHPAFDCGVVGEGEDAFLQLIDQLDRTGAWPADWLAAAPGLVFFRDGRPYVTPSRPTIEPLDQIPPPDRSILPAAEFAHVLTGRGCPYDCRFCASPAMWGAYRSFSAERVAAELADVIEAGHERIHVFDDLFVADLARLVRIADILEDQEWLGAARLSCTVRADLVTDDLAEVLVRLGVDAVTFGLESADEHTQERLGKGYEPRLIRRALAVLASYDIACRVSAIVGEPAETVESMRTTYSFLTEQAAKGRLAGAEVHVLSPWPGNAYWPQAVERGLVGDLATFDWSRLGAPWRGLLLNEQLAKNAGRLVAWDRHTRAIFAALQRPMVLVAPEDADLEIEADPDLLRAIFLVTEENGVAEVLEEGEIDLVRYGPDELLASLRELADQYGDEPLVLFAPEPAAATPAVRRACQLAIGLRGVPFARTRLGTYPLVAVARAAVELSPKQLLKLATGDKSAAPKDALVADPLKLRELPHTDLHQSVAFTGEAVALLDQYAAELAAARQRSPD